MQLLDNAYLPGESGATMGRTDQEHSTAAAPQSPSDSARADYEPPAIAWEDEFAPSMQTADSICQRNPDSCG